MLKVLILTVCWPENGRPLLVPQWNDVWLTRIEISYQQRMTNEVSLLRVLPIGWNKFHFWNYECMKITYVNCGVKNYLKEGHRSCIRNLCMQLRKESLKKNSGRKRGSRTRVDWNGERKYRHSFLLCFLNKCHQIVRHDALLPLWLKKKSTSHGTFNRNLGYLHVRHVLIKETSVFESKHIFHYKSFTGLFVTLLF